jgi:hypothetical protein
MKNPWNDLPDKAPFTLPCDRAYVDAYNKLEPNGDLRINTHLLPEPFHGNPNAPVVVLLLNPGINGDEEQFHKSKDFAAALKESISAKSNGMHFHLTGKWQGPGFAWWAKACKSLLGIPELHRKILSVEFSPYHSKKFAHGHLRMPSQDYSFHLVRKAIERGAVIVCMRGEKYWLGSIPELANYKRFLKLNNPRSASLSARNLSDFEVLASALQGTSKC